MCHLSYHIISNATHIISHHKSRSWIQYYMYSQYFSCDCCSMCRTWVIEYRLRLQIRSTLKFDNIMLYIRSILLWLRSSDWYVFSDDVHKQNRYHRGYSYPHTYQIISHWSTSVVICLYQRMIYDNDTSSRNLISFLITMIHQHYHQPAQT